MKLNKLAAALALSFAAVGTAQAAATIVINNLNAPGVGFNDPTPATPVGGNTGTTVGQQRLIAFKYAADIWGATLTSPVPIIINAQFSNLTCTATSAVLGSAGSAGGFINFPGAPRPNTVYSFALANKLAGAEVSTPNRPQINANFNARLGAPDCLAGSKFYLGLDTRHGSDIDFVATLLHEMGHGLGFQTFTNGLSGLQAAQSATFPGYPAAWDYFLLDNTTNKLWTDMTPEERRASSLKPGGLSWTGPNVTAGVPQVLSPLAQMRIVGYGAKTAGGVYSVGEADFGPSVVTTPIEGQIAKVTLQADSPGEACTPLDAANAAAVRDKIALISRGTCGFTFKVKNAQDAGAIGVIIADNAPGAVTGLGGTDATITIPALRVTQADGARIAASLTKANGNVAGTVAQFGASPTLLAGADSSRRITMFSPNPYQQGSSISHFNTTAKRNQLMEPSISGDLTHSVTLPIDLTFELFKDIGW